MQIALSSPLHIPPHSFTELHYSHDQIPPVRLSRSQRFTSESVKTSCFYPSLSKAEQIEYVKVGRRINGSCPFCLRHHLGSGRQRSEGARTKDQRSGRCQYQVQRVLVLEVSAFLGFENKLLLSGQKKLKNDQFTRVIFFFLLRI